MIKTLVVLLLLCQATFAAVAPQTIIIPAGAGPALLNVFTGTGPNTLSNITGLDATHRVTVVLSNATYNLGANGINLPSYVDILAPSQATITRLTGGPLINQVGTNGIADNALTNLSISQLGTHKDLAPVGDQAFLIVAGVNQSASIFTNVNFSVASPGRNTARDQDGVTWNGPFNNWGYGYSYGLLGLSDISGTYSHCTFSDYSVRAWNDLRVSGNFSNCTFGNWCIGGDSIGEVVDGHFTDCTGGDYSVGACVAFGCDVRGVFTRCNFGNYCLATDKLCAGTFIDSSFGIGTHTASLGATQNTYCGGTWLGGYLADGQLGAGFAGFMSGTTVDGRLVYPGDANMDGIITASDYAQMDAAFLRGITNATWINGDFNGDGRVNGDDYTLANAAWADQSKRLGSYVPAPSTVSSMGVLCFFLMRRRRR